jgi:hypothetical protein
MKNVIGILFLAGTLVFASCGQRDRNGQRAGEEESRDTIYILDNDTVRRSSVPPGATPVTPATPGTQQEGHELRQGEIRDDPAVQQRPRRGDTDGDGVPARRGAPATDTLNIDTQEEGQQQVPRRRGG